jgi:hypothetical protein
MTKTRKDFRPWLECRDEKGEVAFYGIERILLSPELQKRCLEKRELNRILRLIDEDPNLAKLIQEWRRKMTDALNLEKN